MEQNTFLLKKKEDYFKEFKQMFSLYFWFLQNSIVLYAFTEKLQYQEKKTLIYSFG